MLEEPVEARVVSRHERAAQPDAQRVRIARRPRHEVDRAELERADRGRVVAGRGEHDDRQRVADPARVRDQREAIELGRRVIDEQHGERVLGEPREARRRASDELDGELRVGHRVGTAIARGPQEPRHPGLALGHHGASLPEPAPRPCVRRRGLAMKPAAISKLRIATSGRAFMARMNARLACSLAICVIGLHARASRADEPPPAEGSDQPAAPVDAAPAPEPAPVPIHNTPAVLQSIETMGLESSRSSAMSTAEDFLILPDGAELGGDLRTITASGGLGTGALKLTDLALFDAHLEWAIAKHYELDASLGILAKQPSSTNEDVVQGGSITLRRGLAAWSAIAVSGSISPLIDLGGEAFGGSVFVTHKHRLNEIVSFALAAGAGSTILRPTGTVMDTPALVEGAAHASMLVRSPDGIWGGWLGAGYALPVYHRGLDPVSGRTLDPQPRLDVDIGTGIGIADDWYFSADLAIVDRGDLSNPATRLPILDGGFDQVQVTVGVTRRLRDHKRESHYGSDMTDPLIQL